jgi:hypothetical protein
VTIDRHTVALISIVGSSLDLLGAMYLAYDLLGGEHGPLRTLTRGVTYGALFGTGFGLALGPVFGLINGLTHGVTLAWEFSRASRHIPNPGIWRDAAMSTIRGAGYAVGSAYLFGPVFGIAFGAMSAAAQTIAYRLGIRPTMDYQPQARPRLTRHQFLAGVNRTVGYGIAGYLSALIAHQRVSALHVGLLTGLATGIVTVVGSGSISFVEWFADNIPAKRMGVIGIALILTGFALQSAQYWVTLLDLSAGGFPILNPRPSA